MGRPLNKKYFGAGDGDQFRVTAKVPTATVGAGFIVKQTGSKRFVVDVEGVKAPCVLVDKIDADLLDGEMTIQLKNSDDEVKNVVKITGRTAVFSDGTISAWSFADATPGVMEAEEEEDDFTPDAP